MTEALLSSVTHNWKIICINTHLLKLNICVPTRIFYFCDLHVYVCICLCMCMHTYVQQSHLQYFCTQWQPIQIQLKQHRGLHIVIHSSVTHPFPRISLSLCFFWRAEWQLGGWALSLPCFILLSLPFSLPVVIRCLRVNTFYLVWCQDVHLTGKCLSFSVCGFMLILWCNTLWVP